MSSEFDNGTPARVHRPTGTVELAPSFFSLTPDQRQFVLLHEMGHVALDTTSEQAADVWAADNMIKDVGLRRTFRAMNTALHDSLQSDMRRINLFNSLVRYDNMVNGNDMKTIGPCVYMSDSDTMQPYQVVTFEDKEGFRYNNNFINKNFGPSAFPVEAPEFVQWCGFYKLPYNVQSLASYRKAKADAWSNYQELKNGISVGYDPNANEVTVSGGRNLFNETTKSSNATALQSGSSPNKARFGMLLFLSAIAAVAYVIYKKL